MSSHPDLQVSDDGPIRHIILNRPAKLNAIETAQHQRVIDALAEAEADPHVRLVAFSGNGRAFCAGDDLKAVGNDFQSPVGWPERYLRRHMVDLELGIGPMLLQEVTSAIRCFPKPTAALMHGYAVGAGYDYALSCDLRVMTEDCQFGDPRIHRALWSAEGWSYKLPRAIPMGFASRIAYLGELLSGEEAMTIGLAHALLPAGTPVREGAREMLLQIAGFDGNAYRVTKQALLDALDLSFKSALRTISHY